MAKKTALKIVGNAVKSKILFWTHSHVKWAASRDLCFVASNPKVHKINWFPSVKLFCSSEFRTRFFSTSTSILIVYLLLRLGGKTAKLTVSNDLLLPVSITQARMLGWGLAVRVTSTLSFQEQNQSFTIQLHVLSWKNIALLPHILFINFIFIQKCFQRKSASQVTREDCDLMLGPAPLSSKHSSGSSGRQPRWNLWGYTLAAEHFCDQFLKGAYILQWLMTFKCYFK